MKQNKLPGNNVNGAMSYRKAPSFNECLLFLDTRQDATRSWWLTNTKQFPGRNPFQKTLTVRQSQAKSRRKVNTPDTAHEASHILD